MIVGIYMISGQSAEAVQEQSNIFFISDKANLCDVNK